MFKNCRRLRVPARACLLVTLTLCAACAGARGPEAARPRANEPVYPVTLVANAERREQTLNAWQTLAQAQGLSAAPTPELQSVTATVAALPPGFAPRLPKVEIAPALQSGKDEETREALRRFIATAAPLLGSTPRDLSLVELRDGPNGTKVARYRQKPFPHPLRGGYGTVEISFDADGRVTSITSTALPDTERLARALAAQPPKLTAEDAATRLRGRAVTYTDAANVTQTLTVSQSEPLTTRELVVYPVARAGEPPVIELHLAWEVPVGSGDNPVRAYVDAVTGDIIAAALPPPQRTRVQ
ncbi:MAG TPA: PepSY domain-containing protein [Pyrinomonadaceae bacterium]|jgi:hypothetical protein